MKSWCYNFRIDEKSPVTSLGENLVATLDSACIAAWCALINDEEKSRWLDRSQEQLRAAQYICMNMINSERTSGLGRVALPDAKAQHENEKDRRRASTENDCLEYKDEQKSVAFDKSGAEDDLRRQQENDPSLVLIYSGQSIQVLPKRSEQRSLLNSNYNDPTVLVRELKHRLQHLDAPREMNVNGVIEEMNVNGVIEEMNVNGVIEEMNVNDVIEEMNVNGVIEEMNVNSVIEQLVAKEVPNNVERVNSKEFKAQERKQPARLWVGGSDQLSFMSQLAKAQKTLRNDHDSEHLEA